MIAMIRNHMIENADVLRAAALRRRDRDNSGGALCLVNKAAERERVASLGTFDLIRERANAAFADSRAVVRDFRNRLAAGMTADEPIPF